ncbi:MAG: sulfotransferase domain-containing protein [Actinomycetota bacterium]|nr:sulfotransferase domain-containing protein [Actinomycetota bacterium]
MGSLDNGALRRAYFRNRSIDRAVNHRRYRGIRPTDLFIASYPRSGTTWLRFLLFEFLTGAPSDFVSVNRAIPYVGEHGHAPGLLPNGGRLIMTHEAYLKGVGSVIYVVRDPRSVVLSEYLWQLRTGLFDGSFDHFFEAFIAGRANPYGAWDRHAAMWTESALATEGRLHVVRFEDLRNDTSSELTRILSLLGVRLDASVIDEVIAHNALAQMRAKEDAAPLGALAPCARPDIRFVNSGSLTDWKHSLSQDQAQQITKEFRTSLQALRYDVSSIERESTVEAPHAVIGPGAQQPPQTDKPLKVLYIAGGDRSGSTLLDNLLGQVDGFFSTGELRYIWERGELMGWRCGCGQSVTECEIWAVVLEKLHADGATPDAATIVQWQDRVARFRKTFSLLNLTPSGARDHPMLQAYLDLTRRLYSSIAEVTGARVVVDSSKRPSDAAILNLVPGLQLYVIHLVRDPRAVAYSWGKRQADIDRHGVFASSASWVAWNVGSEAVRRRIPERSILLRYEDFVREPRRNLQQILALVSEDPVNAPSNQDGTFEVSATHTVSGNPARFRQGPVKVRPDDEWLDRLGTPRRVAATTMSLPFLRRYGYEIRVPETEPS